MSKKRKTPAGTGASKVVHFNRLNSSNNNLTPPKKQVTSFDDLKKYQEILRGIGDKIAAHHLWLLVKRDYMEGLYD